MSSIRRKTSNFADLKLRIEENITKMTMDGAEVDSGFKQQKNEKLKIKIKCSFPKQMLFF